MTALTPQQMRGIAGELAGNPTSHSLVEAEAALRAAADRLEEMHDVLPLAIDKLGRAGYHSSAQQLRYLTADTAPQEDRDDAR